MTFEIKDDRFTYPVSWLSCGHVTMTTMTLCGTAICFDTASGHGDEEHQRKHLLHHEHVYEYTLQVASVALGPPAALVGRSPWQRRMLRTA